MGIKVIQESEVLVSRRGRTATFDTEMQTAFKSLKKGQALDLTDHMGGPVPKDQRQKVAQEIRKNWRSVRNDDCRIDFGAGRPQVRVKS